MDLNNALVARLLMSELPGLAGALQAGASRPGLGAIGRRLPNQELNDAMLNAVAKLLAHKVSGQPAVPFGMRDGGTHQSYGQAGRGAAVRDAPGMPAGQVRTKSAAGRAGVGAAGEAAQAAAPAAAGGGMVRAHAVVRPGSGRAAGAPAPRTVAHRMEKFTGDLQRLAHPATLPGGWILYGYDKASGRPVYLGRGGCLRVYV